MYIIFSHTLSYVTTNTYDSEVQFTCSTVDTLIKRQQPCVGAVSARWAFLGLDRAHGAVEACWTRVGLLAQAGRGAVGVLTTEVPASQ